LETNQRAETAEARLTKRCDANILLESIQRAETAEARLTTRRIG